MRAARLLGLAYWLVMACGIRAQQVLPIGSPDAADAVSPQSAVLARWPEIRDAITTKDFSKAEESMIKVIGEDPSAKVLLPVLGGVFFLDGKYLNCASAMEKARAAGVLDDASRFTLSMAYVNLKRFDLAREDLQALQTSHPRIAKYIYWLGRLDLADQRLEAALLRFREAAKLDPASYKIFDNIGLCEEGLNRPSEAIADFSHAASLSRAAQDPSPWPSYNLGRMLAKSNRFEEAKPALEEAVRIQSGFAKARYELGLTLEHLGQLDESLTQLYRASSLDRSFADPQYAIARILRRKGQTEASEEALRRFQLLSDREQESRKR